jgi:multiple sugar transport system permease protein
VRVRWWVAYAFLLPALVGLVTFRLVPIGIALVGSFSRTTLLGETVYEGLANYQGLAADPTFWASLRTTLLFNLIINPFQVVCAFALALLVLRPSPGVVIFRTAFFLPMTVSIALTGIIWMLML